MRVLLVEDDPDHAELIRDGFLDFPDSDMEVAGTVDRANARLARGGIDLIVTDSRLPDGCGLDLVRAHARTIPTILMTSHGDEKLAVDAMKSGAVDYVPKTVDSLFDLAARSVGALREWRHIQEKRRVEAELLAERVKLEAIYQNTLDVILITEAESGRILQANAALQRLLGYPIKRMVGQSISLLLTESESVTARPLARDTCVPATLASQQAVRRADGSLCPMEVMATPVPWNDKDALLLSLRDVTERVRAEEALAEERRNLERLVEQRTAELRSSLERLETMNSRLEAASRDKSRFLSSMSHELRTPLNAVLGFAELLERQVVGPLNPKQRDYAKRIETSGKHLLDLIADLLDLGRLDSGTLQLELTRMAPGALLEEVASMMHHTCEAKSLSLATKADPGLEGFVIDRRRMRQVLLNLVSNAAKFTPPGGRIEMRALAADDRTIRLEVEDSGVGIPPAEKGRIFDEFHQADRRRDGDLGGVGIGLAVARKLVLLHGGAIEVESEEGRGSLFRLDIPLAATVAPSLPARRSESTAPALPRPAGGRNRILIVEDNEVNLELLREVLRTEGYVIEAVGDGPAALAAAKRRRPDLVLTDIHLPGMDGRELTGRLLALPGCADLPVISLTANVSPDERAACLAAGCCAFLGKPVDLDQLFAEIALHLHPAPVSG